MKHLGGKFAVTLAIVMLVGCLEMSMMFGCTKKPNGDIYTLEEAYEMGLLSKEDLMSIAYYQHGGRIKNEEIMSEDYKPKPKIPEILDKTVEQHIKEYIFACYLEDPERTGEHTINDIDINNYYGNYNGYWIVSETDNFNMHYSGIWEKKIDGINFTERGNSVIIVWKEN